MTSHLRRLHSIFKYVHVLCYKTAWDDFGFDDFLFISYSVRSFYVISTANQKDVINLLRWGRDTFSILDKSLYRSFTTVGFCRIWGGRMISRLYVISRAILEKLPSHSVSWVKQCYGVCRAIKLPVIEVKDEFVVALLVSLILSKSISLQKKAYICLQNGEARS